MTHIDEPAIRCDPKPGGWACTVTVGEDAAATEHHVEVDRAVLDDLAPGASPEELVRASFEFLLAREPRESIMRAFELPIISRFFADYPEVIRRRFGP
jgi:hypothetical protein